MASYLTAWNPPWYQPALDVTEGVREWARRVAYNLGSIPRRAYVATGMATPEYEKSVRQRDTEESVNRLMEDGTHWTPEQARRVVTGPTALEVYGQNVADGASPGEAAMSALRFLDNRMTSQPGVVSGASYDNTRFLSRNSVPQSVVLSIGGFGAGREGQGRRDTRYAFKPGHETTPVELAGVNDYNLMRFRHFDGLMADDAISVLRAAGIQPVVIGHSYGGDTAVSLGRMNPDVKVHAIDPVSRFHDTSVPDNVKTYLATHGWKKDPVREAIVTVGKRYPDTDDSAEYDGGHIVGTDKVVHSIVGGATK